MTVLTEILFPEAPILLKCLETAASPPRHPARHNRRRLGKDIAPPFLPLFWPPLLPQPTKRGRGGGVIVIQLLAHLGVLCEVAFERSIVQPR